MEEEKGRVVWQSPMMRQKTKTKTSENWPDTLDDFEQGIDEPKYIYNAPSGYRSFFLV